MSGGVAMKRWQVAVVASMVVAWTVMGTAVPSSAGSGGRVESEAKVAAPRPSGRPPAFRSRLAHRSPAAEPAPAVGQTAAVGDVLVIDDPTGAIPPRSDIRQVAVGSPGGSSLRFTMQVEQFSDPATDPAWFDGRSFIGWILDTSGDDLLDVVVYLFHNGTKVVSEVWDWESGTFICPAGVQTDAASRTYSAFVVDPGCLGDVKRPAAMAWLLLDDPGVGEVSDIAPNDDHGVRFNRPDPGAPAGGYTIVSRSSAFQRYGARAPGATGSGVVQALPENPVVVAAGGSRWFSPVLWAATDDGAVATEDGAYWWGDLWDFDVTLSQPIVGMAVLPDASGYWLVGRDGGIFAFGDAAFHGSTGGIPLNKPIVGMASTPTGGGYWLVASDGGIFAFGDARFYGSMGGQHLNRPVVGMAAGLHGEGYWLVASDGGIFSYGLPFYGSTGSIALQQPIVGMAPTRSGGGYRFIARDGGLFSYGDAEFHGSGAAPGRTDVVGLVTA